MKKLLLLLVVLFSPCLLAQEDAIVYFTDKEDVEISIANPISIMTQEAIDRKMLQNTPIDARDVPVNENYITQIKNAVGITVYSKSKWMNCVYVRGSQSQIEDLLNLAFVSSVEFFDTSLNFGAGTGRSSNKFAIENEQNRIVYDYGAAANQITMLRAEYLHELDFTGNGMIVGVLDAGFPSVNTNPGFANMVNNGRLLGTYDFESRQVNVDGTSTHGTKTSSDIGGFLDGEFVGTAPEASFYLFITEYTPTETPVEEAWWVEALERADSLGVDVINTSLSYRDYDNPIYTYEYEDLDGQTTFAARGANHALDKGMLMVNSAGNGGDSSFPTVGTPADSPGVLTIGAVDAGGNYVSFSSRGPTVDGRIKPDVMAQGQASAVIDTNGQVDFNSGTSFSSPIMAGAVTCLWQARPQTRNTQLMQVIRESAHLYNNPTDQMGYGIPNFEDAYNALVVLGIEDQLREREFALYPNPASDYISVSFPEGIYEAKIRIYNVVGKEVLNSSIVSVNNSVDISHLVTGMYIASIESNNKTNNFKLIKK